MTTDPYLHYDQVFVIIRAEGASLRADTPETSIGLVKALWSQAAAEAEVARLNQAGHDAGNVYFWKAARLERREVRSGTS